VLEVVEEQEHFALSDMRRQLFLRPQTPRNGVEDERRIAKRSKTDPEDAVSKLGHELSRRL
jgi:hypothetical protein